MRTIPMRPEDLRKYKKIQQGELRSLRDPIVSERKEYETDREFEQQANLRPTTPDQQTRERRVVYERRKHGW